MRIGMSGTGRWGRRLMAAFARHCEVVLCCTGPSPHHRAWLAATHPATTWVGDFGALAAEPSIDAVVIASPVALHACQAEAALRAGKHVFVEKPAATDAPTAARLAGLAAELGRQLFVGHTALFDPRLHRLSERAATDPVVAADFTWHKFGTFDDPLLWTLLPHEVALALHLFGRAPDGVEVTGRPADPLTHTAAVRLDFGGGRSAALDLDRIAAAPERRIDLTHSSGARRTWRAAPPATGPAADDPLDLEVRAFVRSVATGVPSPSDGAFAVAVARVLDRIAACDTHPAGPRERR